jgi:hypothetical protein
MNHTITETPNNRMYRHASRIVFLAMMVLSAFIFNACEEGGDVPGGPAPTISSFSPESGLAGAAVTINGANLDKVISVYFNNVKATPTTKTASQIVVNVPAGATTGKIKLTYGAGNVETSTAFTVAFKQVLVSDFEEDNVSTKWGLSEDAGDITVSTFTEDGGNTFFHLKGSDTNGNYWVGGRYTGTGNPATPLGVTETDPAKVFFNVDVKSNAAIGDPAPQAKLVFYVFDDTQENKKMNWEIDFPVTWTDWKTISISAEDFHRWNGNGFSPFSGDIETVSEVALYLTGGSTNVYDFSFDNVVFSEGAAMGTIINP